MGAPALKIYNKDTASLLYILRWEILMRGLIFLCFSSLAIFAQPAAQAPTIGGTGYLSPVPLPVAPGQVVTLFVQGINTPPPAQVRTNITPWPTTLAGVSVTYTQGTSLPAPILEVRPISMLSPCLATPSLPAGNCGTILAVTAQLPFQMQTFCSLCGRPDIPATLAVTVNGVAGQPISVQPLNDQVHFLTSCDILIAPAQAGTNYTALPCPAIVTHADGSTVSAVKPAKSGEELVVYAVGLGQTNPPLAEGEPATQAAPSQTVFGIDFNFHPNALPTKPAAPAASGTPVNSSKPLFAGATPGFVGLYQFNFIVPPAPANLAPCVDITSVGPYTNVIESNLTVSIGSSFSFDGAGICVQPGS